MCQLLDELASVRKKIDNLENLDEIEELFKEISPLSTSLAGSKQWEVARRRFYILFDSLEKDILRFLKSSVISLTKVKEKPLRSLKELSRWNGFLLRPNISKALYQEKELILKTIATHIDEMKNEYESRTDQSLDPIPNKDFIPPTKNFSPPLSAIIWTRQFADRIRRLYNYCE